MKECVEFISSANRINRADTRLTRPNRGTILHEHHPRVHRASPPQTIQKFACLCVVQPHARAPSLYTTGLQCPFSLVSPTCAAISPSARLSPLQMPTWQKHTLSLNTLIVGTLPQQPQPAHITCLPVSSCGRTCACPPGCTQSRAGRYRRSYARRSDSTSPIQCRPRRSTTQGRSPRGA